MRSAADANGGASIHICAILESQVRGDVDDIGREDRLLDKREYISAFRFGFGQVASKGEHFDPAAELDRTMEPGTQALDELAVKLPEQFSEARAVNVIRHTRLADFNEAKRQYVLKWRELDGRNNHRLVIDGVTTHTPFLKRLSAFWMNHFSIGRFQQQAKITTGYYELGAIWPNLLGNFADLLIAAELFPSMIYYLNLQTSIGPNSKLGLQKGKGLNENLGREILELHTLGADAGYTQTDVTELAKIMTGWLVDVNKGRTVFHANRAEPGVKTLLGKTFGNGPRNSQFHDALRMLAAEPATARHVGRKLALHFIGPDSDGEAKEIERAFIAGGGELKPVYHRLLEVADGKPFGMQMRNDFEFVISALRAVRLRKGAIDFQATEQLQAKGRSLTSGALRQLTQRLWSAPTPQGWPDDPAFWLSPTVISRRLQWLPKLIAQVDDIEPDDLLGDALGPLASGNTRKTVKLASNRLEGIGLVLASPEFNRR